ncbi:MAG: hypothetical protein ISN29_07165 [Gammaproteobacteria bacterium AqS3]|nr:hypothetical protein [Gammaproteobacteria bacterium AqS3]
MGIDVRLFVEDQLTAAVAEKALLEADRAYSVLQLVFWHKDTIRKKVTDLNHSAKENLLYLVVTDQDTPDNCPAGAVESLGAPLSPNLLYRFAVMEVESWIMADRENFAEFFSVRINEVPQHPDEVSNPKEHLAGLIRKSGSKGIHQAGRGYGLTLGKFVSNCWNVSNAQKHSPSLKRTCQRLQTFRLKRV